MQHGITGTWACPRHCQEGGDAIDLLTWAGGLTFREACEELRIDLPERTQEERRRYRPLRPLTAHGHGYVDADFLRPASGGMAHTGHQAGHRSPCPPSGDAIHPELSRQARPAARGRPALRAGLHRRRGQHREIPLPPARRVRPAAQGTRRQACPGAAHPPWHHHPLLERRRPHASPARPYPQAQCRPCRGRRQVHPHRPARAALLGPAAARPHRRRSRASDVGRGRIRA